MALKKKKKPKCVNKIFILGKFIDYLIQIAY